ncbi:NUDIX domain-containing protein [Photobacterium japonica]|uniref:NUDIX domain-containing protein n=1 Tax=Photobacterium japonica TaxID=2910235 RepID=UPI003D0A4E5E
MKHRIRAAGILIENDTVLLLRVKDASGEYWIPPGGGVEEGDISTKDCLRRECLEETGLTVTVGELLAVREFHETTSQRYHAEFFYHIMAHQGDPHLNNLQGLNDEHYIQGLEWVPLHMLTTLRTYPTDITALIARTMQQYYSLHLGCYIQGDADRINHLK